MLQDCLAQLVCPFQTSHVRGMLGWVARPVNEASVGMGPCSPLLLRSSKIPAQDMIFFHPSAPVVQFPPASIKGGKSKAW